MPKVKRSAKNKRSTVKRKSRSKRSRKQPVDLSYKHTGTRLMPKTQKNRRYR